MFHLQPLPNISRFSPPPEGLGMGRWGDGEMGRWGDGEIYIFAQLNVFHINILPRQRISPAPGRGRG
ncbi:MAG: hypothetical protein F6K24_47015 [Okeania sp. SIO2D1]|nr:hypothetical protein [Okeania sp. SIO2D1]